MIVEYNGSEFIKSFVSLYIETDDFKQRSSANIYEQAREYYGIKKRWKEEKYITMYTDEVLGMFVYESSLEHVRRFRRVFESYCTIHDLNIKSLPQMTEVDVRRLSTVSLEDKDVHSICRTKRFIKEFLS